jgi:hypothetical protein
MLETAQHTENAFVTLTYSDENLPADGSLQPSDLQKWLKRLRKRIDPTRVRYYAVGEYGDTSWRPHYHVGLFGFPSCAHGQTRRRPRWTEKDCCPNCRIIAETWANDKGQIGRIDLAKLETGSANYLAGYVTKKMTKPDDPRLEGRYPEFSRMSLKPGIGGDAIPEVADVVMRWTPEGQEVPMALRHGSVIMPLGKYLVRKLREQSGRDPGPTELTVAQAQAKLHHLSEIANQAPGLKKEVFKSLIQEEFASKVKAKEHKHRLFKRGRHL